jgi:hypothetical protein
MEASMLARTAIWLFAASFFLLLVFAGVGSQPDARDGVDLDAEQSGGKHELLDDTETISRKHFTLVAPKEWRSLELGFSLTRKLYLSGDGKGVSIFDEHGSPLQVGIMVEQFLTRNSLDEFIASLVNAAKQSDSLKLDVEPTVEDIQLSNETPAKLLTTQFLKPTARRSLQFKLCLKDRDANSWVVSAWIVAGEKSELPVPDSDLAKRLRSLLETFSLSYADSK